MGKEFGIVQVVLLVLQVAGALVGASPLVAAEPAGAGPAADPGADVAVLPGKDLRSLLADPVPGRRLAGVEERARGLPEILELSTVSVRESYVFPGHIVVAIDVTLARG